MGGPPAKTASLQKVTIGTANMKRAEIPLLIAIFLDLVGFGMAFPDVQLRAEAYGAPGWAIGGLLASLFLVQFFASPYWGSLSDRVGRKPVIVLCAVLSAASMFVYAYASNVWWILLSRVLGGFAAANVVVAQAYLADITQEDERPAAMGRIGAAISAGLVGGPALGGFLAKIGGNHLLGMTAGSMSALGALTLAIFLTARSPKHEQIPGKRPVLDFHLLNEVPKLRRFVLLAAVSWFALACLEGTFGRLIHALLGFGQLEFGLIFSFESLVAILVQGLLIGWLSKRVSDTAVLRLGFLLTGAGLALTPLAPGLAVLFAFSGIYALGSALANPTINAACSSLTPPERQGELFGLLQGSRSMGFLIGPLLGGLLFDWRPQAPYVLAGSVGVLAAVLVPSLPHDRRLREEEQASFESKYHNGVGTSDYGSESLNDRSV